MRPPPWRPGLQPEARPKPPPLLPPRPPPPMGPPPPPTGAGHALGRAGGGAAAGRVGADRAEHGGVVVGSHGDQRALGPGQAPRGEPGDTEPAPGPHLGWEGELHPSHRLRRRAGPGGGPRPQLELRARRRRHGKAGRGPPRPRRPGPRRGPGEVRRHTDAPGPRDQRRRGPRLPGIRDRLRGPGAQGPHRQGRPRRLRRCHGHAHEPRHARDHAVGAEADAGPGSHHRGGRPRVPGRVPGRRPPQPGGDRCRSRGHPDVHLRPPHHPGRGVRALPHVHDRMPHGAARLLRVGVRGHGRALPARTLAGRRQRRGRRVPAAW